MLERLSYAGGEAHRDLARAKAGTLEADAPDPQPGRRDDDAVEQSRQSEALAATTERLGGRSKRHGEVDPENRSRVAKAVE